MPSGFGGVSVNAGLGRVVATLASRFVACVDGAVEATVLGKLAGIVAGAVVGAVTGSDVAGSVVSDGLAIAVEPAIANAAHAQANDSFIIEMLTASPE
jgi:hypothetical protein